jgi:formylglycine-generating enzyme required for sulfatase activity
MVLISTATADFCIDQHEVTQSAYAAFLGGPAPSQTPPCNANDFPEPSCEWNPVATPNRPVVCVDWCDAAGFCQAQGKHLCGRIGGGTLDATNPQDAEDEWYAACSHDGSLPYPYGVLYDGSACNGIDATTISPVDVGSFAKCVGGYPGVFDMSGNVAEWQAACDSDGCFTRGGSYLDLPALLSCNNVGKEGRTLVDKAIGFRCCL